MKIRFYELVVFDSDIIFFFFFGNREKSRNTFFGQNKLVFVATEWEM